MKDSLGRTPLHCACQFRSNKLAIWLSSSGAKWDTVAVDGMTALHWACRSVCSVKVVEELLQVLRDKINARDAAGRTPLHWACVSDYCTVAIVRRLLDNGAKIDALDNEGRTPLLYAVSRKTFDVVEHLWNTGLECHVSESYFSLAVFLCMQLKDVHLLQKMLALPKPEGMFAGELSPSITSELTLWVNRKKLALPQTRSVSLLYP
jgi:ankyrin repeat protein